MLKISEYIPLDELQELPVFEKQVGESDDMDDDELDELLIFASNNKANELMLKSIPASGSVVNSTYNPNSIEAKQYLECKHSCKDKTKCNHVCCQRGVRPKTARKRKRIEDDEDLDEEDESLSITKQVSSDASTNESATLRYVPNPPIKAKRKFYPVSSVSKSVITASSSINESKSNIDLTNQTANTTVDDSGDSLMEKKNARSNKCPNISGTENLSLATFYDTCHELVCLTSDDSVNF